VAKAEALDGTLPDCKLLTRREVLKQQIGRVCTAPEEKLEQVLQYPHVSEDHHHEPRKSALTGRMESVRAPAPKPTLDRARPA